MLHGRPSQPVTHRAGAHVGGLAMIVVLGQVAPHDLQVGVANQALQGEEVYAAVQATRFYSSRT